VRRVCVRASLKTFWRALARGPGAREVGGTGGEGDRGGGSIPLEVDSGGGIADGIVVGCVYDATVKDGVGAARAARIHVAVLG